MRKLELVGVPVRAATFGNSHGVLARSPNGQPDMFYISCFLSGRAAALFGYHSATKEFIRKKLDTSGGYGCCVGADGAVYIGGVRPGNLYRYDPTSDKVENLGGEQFGVSFIWTAVASRDGKIYGACHPTCSVLEYDIAANTLRDLGRVNDSEAYARSICIDHLGNLWVGVGTEHAHLVVLDPKTGERTDILPLEYAGNSCCSNLHAAGKYVLAGMSHDGTMLVFDAETRCVVRVLAKADDSERWMNVHGAPVGEAYVCSHPDGHLYHHDIETDKLTLVAGNLGQCKQVVGNRYVHGVNDQHYFLYDLKENRSLDRVRLRRDGEGMSLYTLTSGPDGNIYGSTYINQHLFRCEPDTGTLTDLGKVIRTGGQVDSIHTGRDGRIYLGSYTHATLSVYDPAQPWQPGRAPGCNPRELGCVGHGQYRTKAIALGPYGNIWVGTVPSYNSAPTGAFSRRHPETGEHRTWVDLVPDGAVQRMAVDDKYVYCADGGDLYTWRGSEQKRPGHGVFFVWDPKEEKKIVELARKVFSLVAAPDGTIIGNSGAEMFVFDPAKMAIIATFASPIGPMSNMCVAPNGKVYGASGRAVCEVDPETLQTVKIAAKGGNILATDAKSRVYLGIGPELYRLR